MVITARQKWLRTLAWLRREFPCRYPVVVRSQRMAKDDGETEICKGPQFIIRIASDRSTSARIDAAIHEWSHALTWYGAETEEDHSSEWGLAYAKIYRAHVEWNYGRPKNET